MNSQRTRILFGTHFLNEFAVDDERIPQNFTGKHSDCGTRRIVVVAETVFSAEIVVPTHIEIVVHYDFSHGFFDKIFRCGTFEQCV